GGSYVLKELDGSILQQGVSAFQLLPYVSHHNKKLLKEIAREVLYNFDLFGSHASLTALPKPKFGQCHRSWRGLPNAYFVMVVHFR
ncbi:hypothetical protein PILCRDRAFT_72004, partial [Piloderma croceum F 1598]